MKNIKVTKLKYTDTNGKLCLLGIFVDTSENMSVFRDKVTTTEDYEKARSNSLIFAHIANALAHGYLNLYYVDIYTEEFIEYKTNNDGALSESRRGWHFFEECQDIVNEKVYEEDIDSVLEAVDRKTLEKALKNNKSFKRIFL
jgi:hypothetical protein